MTALTNQATKCSAPISEEMEIRASSSENQPLSGPRSPIRTPHSALRIALLTGGGDKPYALGLAEALTSAGLSVDFIGSDELDVPELVNNPRVNFLNLRGNQRPETNAALKGLRVLRYYARLIRYAATAKPAVFHILWNNKFQFFDCTLLMLYYKVLGKRVVLTAHNINIGKRDLKDSFLNRLSLRSQYRLSDHVFVHNEGMRGELISSFGVHETKVSSIPFGINNTVPNTALTSLEAKQRLGLGRHNKTLLFFGNIAPYKGLEYLVAAFSELAAKDDSYRLLIIGRPKGPRAYCDQIRRAIEQSASRDRIIDKIEYVPDEATQLYFKAADVLVLPYKDIFQSGVLLLGYSFGVPAVAADIGSLRDDIVEGKTGFIFKSEDSADLARVIAKYFESDIFRNLEAQRKQIKTYANERYSWQKVAKATISVYLHFVSAK